MTAVQSLVQVNYWKDRVTVAAATTAISGLKLFSGHDDSATNDLFLEGILPDNRQGQITGIFFKILQKHLLVPEDQQVVWQEHIDLIESLWFTIYVNSTEHTRAPIAAFPHPPIWFTGIASQDAAANSTSGLVQNGGYMLFFQNIEVGPRQRIRVELDTKKTLTSTSEAVDIECQLQTLDEKAA